jgi:uncharacterized protein
MLHFEGNKEFPQTPEELQKKLSDARFLVQCIPDVESVSRADVNEAVCTIRPGFAFVRGTLELTIQVAEAQSNSRVKLMLQTKGIGSTSDVLVSFSLADVGSGTRLHWVAEVQNLGGLLKAVPQGLTKAAAQKVIGDVLAMLEKSLQK